MTKIVFFRRDGLFYGFEERGHSGYGEAGNDILCAALSAMTMLILNTVEISFAGDVEYEIDDKATRISVKAMCALPEYESDEKRRYAVEGIFKGYYYQLNDLLEEYYEHLDVEVIDD